MAKKKEESSSFNATVEALNKKYGVGSIMTLNAKHPDMGYSVIPTGSLGFDYQV